MITIVLTHGVRFVNYISHNLRWLSFLVIILLIESNTYISIVLYLKKLFLCVFCQLVCKDLFCFVVVIKGKL